MCEATVDFESPLARIIDTIGHNAATARNDSRVLRASRSDLPSDAKVKLMRAEARLDEATDELMEALRLASASQQGQEPRR